MPTPFVADTFTGSDGAALESHTVDTGGPIAKVSGSAGSAVITNANRARPTTTGSVVAYDYATAPASSNYVVLADVYVATLLSGSCAAGVIVRAQPGAETFYMFRLNSNPVPFQGFDIYKAVGGSFTMLTQSSSIGFSSGETVKLSLQVFGTAITTLIGTYSLDGGTTWQTACIATDSSSPITNAGSAGLNFYTDYATSDTTGVHLGNLSAIPMPIIAPNNSAWFSSPGNWVLSSTTAISTDLGAKRSIVFANSPVAALSFDLSALTTAGVASSDYPQIRYSIDDGPTTDVPVSASVQLFNGSSGASHEVVYEFVRGNYTLDSYNTPVMAVRETGLILGTNAAVSPPTDLQPQLMFVTGDSITAGVSILSSATPGGVDATVTFAKALGPALGAEVGTAGKGAVGWAFAGQGNVPAFPTEWKYAWSGQARSFPALARIVAVMGTNDSLNSIADSAVTSAVTSWLSDARATLGASVWIHVVIPFGGFKRSAITAGVSSYLSSNPGSKAVCIDLGVLIEAGLSGPYGTATRQAPFDGIHPSEFSHAQVTRRFRQQCRNLSYRGRRCSGRSLTFFQELTCPSVHLPFQLRFPVSSSSPVQTPGIRCGAPASRAPK
jgi:hypothetical protein